MEVMIENSDAFVIFPGGSGTVQELLALLIFKQQGNPLMEGKPVVIFNRMDASGKRFFTPLIDLLEEHAVPGMFTVVDELDEILPTLMEALAPESMAV
jgi:predicted Rossmann-fold nucleotide-binding protein